MTETIPILDFELASLQFSDEDYIKNNLEKLANEIVSIFSSVGFFFLQNHGVSNEDIEEFHKYTRLFFNLPEEIKQKYLRDEDNHGWSPFESEVVNQNRPGDLKESFNVTSFKKQKKWPEEVPEFKIVMLKFFHMMANLSLRILRLIAIGLKLDNPSFFQQFHSCFSEENMSNLRTLQYPSLTGKEIKLNQIRCGEHCDFGTITVLFQDETGGLEVLNKENEFIPVTPKPGLALVNIGTLMQKWSDNRLIATMHRVVAPKDDKFQRTERRSLAFFLYPDYSFTIKSPLNDDDEPINAGDYANMKFAQIYGKR